MTQEVGENLPVGNINFLEQLRLHLDVYRNHFELFVKAMGLYFAALGAIGGLMYRDGVSRSSQVAFSALIVSGSIIFLDGCIVSLRWVRDLEVSVRGAEMQLGIKPFPFSGANGVIGVMMVVCVIFALFGVVNLAILAK